MMDTPGLDVVAEAADGTEGVLLARSLAPDVVVLDVGISGINGIEAARRITAEISVTRVVGLSMYRDAGHVLAILAAGASGYVLKQDPFSELAAAIRTVAAGGCWLSPGLPSLGEAGHTRLSERELQVVSLLADGTSYKEIAARLGVGIKSVETYRKRATLKLGAWCDAPPTITRGRSVQTPDTDEPDAPTVRPRPDPRP